MIDYGKTIAKSKIKHINKEDIAKITKEWTKKSKEFINSKYKSLIQERSMIDTTLSDIIAKELKTTDIESVPISTFFKTIEKLVLKKLAKLEIKDPRLMFENRIFQAPKQRSFTPTDHQKQQLLKAQVSNSAEKNIRKSLLNYESLNRKPIEKINKMMDNEVENWAMISKFNQNKYDLDKSVLNQVKSKKQKEINNILKEKENKRLNEDDYYDYLERENSYKMLLNNVMKEKTLKDKILSMQNLRNNFAKSKIFSKSSLL